MALARTRWLRRLLTGLYLAAQVAGVVPLIHDHTLNIFETTPIAGHVHVHLASNTAQPDADHHHGLIDFHDQCCAIHSLSGPLPPAIAVAPAETAGIPVSPAPLIARVGFHPARLDRPPKSLPLI